MFNKLSKTKTKTMLKKRRFGSVGRPLHSCKFNCIICLVVVFLYLLRSFVCLTCIDFVDNSNWSKYCVPVHIHVVWAE